MEKDDLAGLLGAARATQKKPARRESQEIAHGTQGEDSGRHPSPCGIQEPHCMASREEDGQRYPKGSKVPIWYKVWFL